MRRIFYNEQLKHLAPGDVTEVVLPFEDCNGTFTAQLKPRRQIAYTCVFLYSYQMHKT